MTIASDSSLPLRLDAWTASDIGLVRSDNEDAYRSTPARGMFILADGMGGHEAGEIASSMAVDAAHSALSSSGGRDLFEAFLNAQVAVYRASTTHRAYAGMGTTLIAAIIRANNVSIAWVGDSRAYLYRSGVLMLLTQDHGSDGYLNEWIGKPGGCLVGQTSKTLQYNDRILLCTDGLSNFVPEETIRQRIRDERTPKKVVERLIADALEFGGQDNCTVSLIRIVR